VLHWSEQREREREREMKYSNTKSLATDYIALSTTTVCNLACGLWRADVGLLQGWLRLRNQSSSWQKCLYFIHALQYRSHSDTTLTDRPTHNVSETKFIFHVLFVRYTDRSSKRPNYLATETTIITQSYCVLQRLLLIQAQRLSVPRMSCNI